jgi:hypothetical protein
LGVPFLGKDAAELEGMARREPTGIEEGVDDIEHLCQEARNLLVKMRLMLKRVRDLSIPESMSSTISGILEALAVKEDGEDPLVATVRRPVTTSSESVFSMLMMHGVEFDADKVTGTYPKDKDGYDVAPKAFLERARDLSTWMANFLADRNARRAALKARKHSAASAPSSNATGSSN